MTIAVNPMSRAERWMEALTAEMPDEDLRLWPDIGDVETVEYLIAWAMPDDDLPNLRAILALGAGTEQFQVAGVPQVPIVRLVDPAMADEMAAYALAWVLRHHRRFADAEALQRDGAWQVPPIPPPLAFRVGLLGHGEIGRRIGRAFADLGYSVNAWSRSGHDDTTAIRYVGIDELSEFLAHSDAVVNVLPSTPETRGLLTGARFGDFAEGSIFVNIGRGNVVADEAALLDALDSGPLAAAVLDVTEPEPPAPGSPLFTHRRVTLTAHVAGRTRVSTAAALIAANVARLRRGESPFPVVDRTAGY